jgi:hypothetical protein
MTDPQKASEWKKGDPPLDIGWDDEDEDHPPRKLSPDEQALHVENMAALNRIMRAYAMLKIGLTALVIVIIIRVFGG